MNRVTDREMAVAVLQELAECEIPTFSPHGYYEDDADIVAAIADRFGLPMKTSMTWHTFAGK